MGNTEVKFSYFHKWHGRNFISFRYKIKVNNCYNVQNLQKVHKSVKTICITQLKKCYFPWKQLSMLPYYSNSIFSLLFTVLILSFSSSMNFNIFLIFSSFPRPWGSALMANSWFAHFYILDKGLPVFSEWKKGKILAIFSSLFQTQYLKSVFGFGSITIASLLLFSKIKLDTDLEPSVCIKL